MKNLLLWYIPQAALVGALVAGAVLFSTNTAILYRQTWAWDYGERVGLPEQFRSTGIHCEYFTPFSVFFRRFKNADVCPRTLSVSQQ
ncbi:hypothetical protein [Bosea sp. NBC_00550]|uniref:hypothetical protein n=1 Tax=Bosea sp. NBC_00550 TaxID=2969621 RepID=UPI00222EB3B5|nr:hypothetical protein [Bosea sp. NBC_00550]UZF93185.1 hypothetical protein NWE53_02930 [Bosea sp. NBC_00550]